MWGAVFPGQGSQHPGMGKFLFEEFKVARETFEEASDTLGLDFKKLCFDGTDEELALTKNTQPALLLVSTATERVLKSLISFKPVGYSGHSVGEYAALVATGAISLPNALKAVRRRGEAMQEAVPVGQGAMAAVMGLTPIQVIEMCQWAEKEGTKASQNPSVEKPLEPANFNCPGQIVISGRATLMEWTQKNFTKEVYPQVFSEKADAGSISRVKFIPLKVSAPFHCSMMKPAEDVMRQMLTATEFTNTSSPVVQNFTAQPTTNAATLRENVIRQISAPVRWIECTEQMHSLGATKFVEVGCGKVLGGLVKKILGEKATTYSLNSLEELKAVTG